MSAVGYRRETIFAAATGPAVGALTVFRLSGPQSEAALRTLTGKAPPAARCLTLRSLADPASGEAIDRGLVAWFPSPDSDTGEDVVEFHVHGGRAVASALAECLSRVAGLRPAEPGEFTRRAFGAGKLDLAQAEAVADLVAADTAAQRRQALRQLDGALGVLYEGWRVRLVAAASRYEAEIDFSDEDLPNALVASVGRDLRGLAADIAAHLNDKRRGEILRDGFEIAILGAPNVGKSSLLNRLAGRDAAIVSQTAGTTRDVIEVHLDLGGYPVTFVDTAGLREQIGEAQEHESIEREGIKRALRRAEQADLKLLVFDACKLPDLDRRTLALAEDNSLVVVNKIDLAPNADLPDLPGCAGQACGLSAKTGAGVEGLVAALTGTVASKLESGGGSPLTRARHRAALEDCRTALGRALEAEAAELAAEDLRHAAHALGRITGRIDVEEILDVIFADFCIGK
ncbi:MAG: tRNA uridine-5-carboxymethylaminomethyl(34) synthesis GTPase MnmE [Alphaproteobacteria bacterium]|nr:tRNA uridine-5-carboxymethylaminomethyl(34) synthesis GTPase MnmE [Alphaproteobacteria bacterium]